MTRLEMADVAASSIIALSIGLILGLIIAMAVHINDPGPLW